MWTFCIINNLFCKKKIGYIPGLNFRYGKSYSRAADDSMSEFGERQNELKRKLDSDHSHRSSSAPKMSTMRSEEEVSRALKDYEQKKRFRGIFQLFLLEQLNYFTFSRKNNIPRMPTYRGIYRPYPPCEGKRKFPFAKILLCR